MASCPLCRSRKGRRTCPAKGESICPHCCGTKRLVEIDCPQDCVYLSGAHAAAWEGRETERRRDARRLAPLFARLSRTQGELVFRALSFALEERREWRDLDDRLFGQAVSALRKTVETRTRGILYEHPAEDARAQGLLVALAGCFQEPQAEGQARPAAPNDRDLLAALSALEAGLGSADPASPSAFLDCVARSVGHRPTSKSPPPRATLIEP